ncbi:hypothetical protein [Aeromonas veronii]|uniref:hypothetical protein n=1 Tax=Aeromonas veronii TaxID=654 RepID=UPI003B9E7425
MEPDRQNRQTACWRFVFICCLACAAKKRSEHLPLDNILHVGAHSHRPAAKETSSPTVKTESGLQIY